MAKGFAWRIANSLQETTEKNLHSRIDIQRMERSVGSDSVTMIIGVGPGTSEPNSSEVTYFSVLVSPMQGKPGPVTGEWEQ
jgi:hypothetical protein